MLKKLILLFIASYCQFSLAQKYQYLSCGNTKVEVQNETQCKKECKPFANLNFFVEFEINIDKQLVMLRMLQDASQTNFYSLGKCIVINKQNFQCQQKFNPNTDFVQDATYTLSKDFYYSTVLGFVKDQNCGILIK